MKVSWEAGTPLYRDPRHVFDETSRDRQTVRKMVDLFEDHKEDCLFCQRGVSRKSMTVTFEKEARAA